MLCVHSDTYKRIAPFQKVHAMSQELIPNESRRLITRDAAAYCGLSSSLFEKWRLTGEGPAFLRIGRRVLYDRNDLDAFLAKHRFDPSQMGGHEDE